MREDLAVRASVPAPAGPVVLVVDDERALVDSMVRRLTCAGFQAIACHDGSSALKALKGEQPIEAVISDVRMPNMDGIELLRLVRQTDLNLPVILVTGGPTLETAIKALDHGAFKYLIKPVDFDELHSVTLRAVQLHMLAKAKVEAFEALGHFHGNNSDPIALQTAFDRALKSLWPAFQPIVWAEDGSLFAYEALLRSEESSLPHPDSMIDAAERLGQLEQLGRTMRQRATEQFATLQQPLRLFLNLHPTDLHDADLLARTSSSLRIASRIVLEVTERVPLGRVRNVRPTVSSLRDAGYQIAIDDLGSGYSGLNSFAVLEPEFVKLDMELVRGVDESPVKQRLVKHMTSLCHDMGMRVVAEGIETEAERDLVVQLGCDLLQGFRFGMPSSEFLVPSW